MSPDSGSRETPRPSPALPLLVGLFFGVPASMEGPGPLIALYLVLVSSLTLPHAAVVSYMDLRPELSLPEGPLQLLARRRRSRREEETPEVGLPGGGWGKKWSHAHANVTGGEMPQRVEGNIEVEAPVQQVYEYWQNLENLPQFMSNIEDVRSTGPDTTHWVVKGPLGAKVEFDAKTTQDEPNTAIGWNTVDGQVQTSGQVRFQEVTPSRTRVEVQMNYADLPGGKVGEVASRVVANPKLMMEQDLKNFKDIIEGNATPEEVQQRPSAATAQSGAVAFLTSGAGLLIVGGGLVLWLLLRRGSSGRGKSRIIFEF